MPDPDCQPGFQSKAKADSRPNDGSADSNGGKLVAPIALNWSV